MNRINKDWEYNILGIDNYNKPDKLKIYYDFIIKNHNKLEGDILEIGVFNGKTLFQQPSFERDRLNENSLWI